MTAEQKIEEIKRILSEQPVNQWETPGEAQAKLARVEKVVCNG